MTHFGLLEKIMMILRSVAILIVAISFSVLAYSHYEIMKAQRVQAVSVIIQQDNTAKNLTSILSYKLLSGGFSIEEVYLFLYKSENIFKFAKEPIK